MWFALTVVMAASLAVGVGFAGAASTKKSGGKTVKPTTLNCSVSMTTEPPSGSNTVDQPASQGSQYGPIHCGTAGFGGGIISDSFTVPDSGDNVGTYTAYYSAGSIKGAFDLTPQEQPSPFESGSFQSQTYQGTVTVTGGTGVYKGITGVKTEMGTMNCTSPDTIHLTCTEKVKVKLPATA
jgi:hypothetical protein